MCSFQKDAYVNPEKEYLSCKRPALSVSRVTP